MLKQLANAVSNILNPFSIGVLIILIVSFSGSDIILEAIKWSLILISINILPIFLLLIYLVRHHSIDGILSNTRGQRTKIYVLALIISLVSCTVLCISKAPLILLSLNIAGLSGIISFMFINLRWKISLHTAFITALATVLYILYGLISVITVVLIPLVAWSRIELKQHTIVQVITGALLGNIILVVVFYFMGQI